MKTSVEERSEFLAQKILVENQNLITESISTHLSSSIAKALSKGIDSDSLSSKIKVKLLSTLNSLSYDDMVFNQCSILA